MPEVEGTGNRGRAWHIVSVNTYPWRGRASSPCEDALPLPLGRSAIDTRSLGIAECQKSRESEGDAVCVHVACVCCE